MDKDDIKKKVMEEEDFVRFPKLFNSIAKFLAKNPEGVKNGAIARLLLLSEEEVESIYNEAVELLKKEMEE